MVQNPHEILDIFFNLNSAKVCMLVLTPRTTACANVLVNEVQMVYQSQGIDISDNIEVIVANDC